MPLLPEDIARLVENVPGVLSVTGDEIIVHDMDGPPALLVDVIDRHLPDYARVTGWEQMRDRHVIGRIRVRIHTGEATTRPLMNMTATYGVPFLAFGANGQHAGSSVDRERRETDAELRIRLLDIAVARALIPGDSYISTEIETATGDGLEDLADQYGTYRLHCVDIQAPGSISKSEIKVRVPGPEYLSRYDRAEVL